MILTEGMYAQACFANVSACEKICLVLNGGLAQGFNPMFIGNMPIVQEPEVVLTDVWETLANATHSTWNTDLGVGGAIYRAYTHTAVGDVKCEKYDPSSNTWTPLNDGLWPLLLGSNVSYTDKLYVFGRSSASGDQPSKPSNIRRVLIWDFASDTWSDGTPLPAGTAFGPSIACGLYDGKVYLFGVGVNMNETWMYDIAAGGTWTKKATIPPTVNEQGGHDVTVGSKIYLVGGYNWTTEKYTNEVWVYDIAADSFSRKADMPTPRGLSAQAVVNGKIYVIGGRDDVNYLDTVEVYDPATNTWATKASMPTAREYARAVVVDGKIHVICGYNGNPLSIHERYTP